MAQTVHLYLKANGEDVQGESTQVSEGRENSIECTYFEAETVTTREVQTGLATGRRQHKPLIIRKAIDKSTPLLAKALTKNTVIEGEFKFFRPNPGGDGTTQHFFTVKVTNGRVANQKVHSQWTEPGQPHAMPPQEEVQFVFQTIVWRYELGGVEHEDSWKES
ncbi:MAG TPA: type VI secretion system tube protein TssD [Myxococcaceae bacterium]